MASAYRGAFFIHLTQDSAGRERRRFVSKPWCDVPPSRWERIDKHAGTRWYRWSVNGNAFAVRRAVQELESQYRDE